MDHYPLNDAVREELVPEPDVCVVVALRVEETVRLHYVVNAELRGTVPAAGVQGGGSSSSYPRYFRVS